MHFLPPFNLVNLVIVFSTLAGLITISRMTK